VMLSRPRARLSLRLIIQRADGFFSKGSGLIA
jgi:hypothetical protein